MTFSLMTLDIMTFSITTLGIMAFSIMTISIMGLFVTLSMNDTHLKQHSA
jgi:hypothetical protein